MTQEEIKTILPHRGNMLLLDEVYKEDEYAHGKFLIRDDAWFLDGHFPGNPIVPGVIQCEILAQSICILLSDQMTEDKIAVYTGLNNVRFKSQVKPGDVFEWYRTHTYWLITLQDVDEIAYFRGEIRRCDYQINWLDDEGNELKTFAAIRGPVETKINFI